jgi:hypothetical protein
MRFSLLARLAAAAVAALLSASVASAQTSAVFLQTDTATQGNWRGVYGSDGAIIYSDGSGTPAYAQVSFSGQGPVIWTSSTSDVRALQKAAASSDRIASGWYTFSSFTIDLNLTDSSAHQVALYCLDWDNAGRTERIDILDASTSAVLDTRTLSNFQNGTSLVWSLKGHVTIRVTVTGGANAVVSGLFFATPAPSTSVAFPHTSGWTETFTFTAHDPLGVADISSIWAAFNSGAAANGNCLVSYAVVQHHDHDR